MPDYKTLNCPGIYKIINKTNGKIYIGSTCVNLRRRIERHIRELLDNKHPNVHLQSSWIKYGQDNFKFEVVETFEPNLDVSVILDREQFYMDLYKSYVNSNGYNICEKAGSPERKNLSDDHKRKISESLMGNKFGDDRKKRLSISLIGRKMPDGFADKIKKLKTGLKQTEECIEKRARPYSFIDESGNIFEGTNLKRFAEKHGCHRGNLKMVLDGKRKSHHGFTRNEIQPIK